MAGKRNGDNTGGQSGNREQQSEHSRQNDGGRQQSDKTYGDRTIHETTDFAPAPPPPSKDSNEK